MAEQKSHDQYLWLEEIQGEKAIDWVKKQNQRSLDILQADSRYHTFFETAKQVYTSKDKIPYVSIRKGMLYNFWQDDIHVRGLWRRTTLDEYLKQKPTWEVLLDFDELARIENENWVFKGAQCYELKPDMCLISLSRGGKDAVVLREFDLKSRTFVPDGFHLPEAKLSAEWIDENTLAIGTDFGPGSLTQSGYPRLIKVWRRGTRIKEAETLFTGNEEDVSVSFFNIITPERSYGFVYRGLTFYTRLYYWWENGKLIPLPIPETAELSGVYRGELIVQLKKEWKGFPSGAVVSFPLNSRITEKDINPKVLYLPTESQVLNGLELAQRGVFLSLLDNVKGKLELAQLDQQGWKRTDILLPTNGSLSHVSADLFSDLYFVGFEDFLTPPTLYYGILGQKKDTRPLPVKSLPEVFSKTLYKVEQKWATSKDGTEVPYFLVSHKNIEYNGKNPTLLYGYGGFEISLDPSYLSATGKIWLERGGVYVLSNIRGGGEFGPKWHQSALKENRQRAYDDFHAIAEDLIGSKVTSPQHLGIMGGSNGGLLVGVAFTQRPDLYGAVVCQVPLLDMLRFHKLLAGASWMAEYGNPDNLEERRYIERYSPYQNLKSNEQYPQVFFVTSTKDDRVHPGHARKMAALMQEFNHPFFYYENIDGGHAGAANLLEMAKKTALTYVYLWQQLGPK